MNITTKKRYEKIADQTEDEDARDVILLLLDEIESLEDEADRLEDAIRDAEAEMKDWMNKYYDLYSRE